MLQHKSLGPARLDGNGKASMEIGESFLAKVIGERFVVEGTTERFVVKVIDATCGMEESCCLMSETMACCVP